MSSHADLTHSMAEVTEIERSDEDMTGSEGIRSDPIRPLAGDSNWDAAIAAARQEGRRQGIASAKTAHLQSFPRYPSYGVGSANYSVAPSAGTSVPSTSTSAPMAGPSTFVPT